jgi:hypothetical protein
MAQLLNDMGIVVFCYFDSRERAKVELRTDRRITSRTACPSPSTKHQILNTSQCSISQGPKRAAPTVKKWFSVGPWEHSGLGDLFRAQPRSGDRWCLGLGDSSKPVICRRALTRPSRSRSDASSFAPKHPHGSANSTSQQKAANRRRPRKQREDQASTRRASLAAPVLRPASTCACFCSGCGSLSVPPIADVLSLGFLCDLSRK